MTVPEVPSTTADFIPVSRESFLETESSFYSALATKRPEDKLVLIRLPAELSAADLDFQGINANPEETADQGLLGTFTVNEDSKKDKSLNGASVRRSPRLISTYAIRVSSKDRSVSALTLAEPLSSGNLSSTQRVRLNRAFDAVWTVNSHVQVSLPPLPRIRKAVAKRAERPLVEQPKNLKMRLLPFSTPSHKN